MIKAFKPVCLMVALALVLSLGALVLPLGLAAANGLEAVITADPEEGTAPLTVDFDAGDSTGDIDEYIWDFGDGEEATGECVEHTFDDMGVYTVTLTVTDDEDNEDSAEVEITVDGVARFTAGPLMGEAPLTVQFRDQSTGATEWRWSFGDGESSTTRSPSHIYQNEGIYTVSLTVKGPDTDTIEGLAAHEVKQGYIVVEDGAFPASLRVSDLNVTPTYAQSGQAVYITATVTNDGGSWGSNEMQLLINGQFEQSAPVGMAPGTSQTIDFTVYKTQAREYQVTMGDATATFFVMEEAAQPTQRAGLLAGGTLDTGGIIAIIAIGVILVGGVVVIFLFSRRSS